MNVPARVAGLFALLSLALSAAPEGCLANGPIYLRGVVEAHCSIVVSALPAESILPSTSAGSRRIQVGTILQNCNQKTGFTLTAASAICATVPAEATAIDTAPQGALPYAVNPDGGGDEASVTDLLADSCSTAVESSVAVERSVDGTSTLYVSFNMN